MPMSPVSLLDIDLANGLVYLAQGDWPNAALSAGAAIPAAG